MATMKHKNKTISKQATAWVQKYPDVLETWKQSNDPFKKAAAETMQELAGAEA